MPVGVSGVDTLPIEVGANLTLDRDAVVGQSALSPTESGQRDREGNVNGAPTIVGGDVSSRHRIDLI